MSIVLPDCPEENSFTGLNCNDMGNHLILEFVNVDKNVNLDDMDFLD